MIRLSGISHSFSGKELFSDLDWSVRKGRKYGLVGPNGSGKTTLLEIIAGLREPEGGKVSVPSGLSAGYLSQETDPRASDSAVVDRVLESSGGPAHAAERVLFGLGFSGEQTEGPVSALSGGWRMRVELAAMLLREPGVLFLDEPTNHLDIKSIGWLEGYLGGYGGTVVMVSHDKYLLDRMVDAVAELRGGKIREFRGGYSSYLEQRERLSRIEDATARNREKKLRAQRRFIERFRYKASKARQVQSRIKMLEKNEIPEPPARSSRTLGFSFPEPERAGRVVCEISGFSKKYELPGGKSNVVFENCGALRVERGDRIAVTGRNGEGKTTLARMIAGEESFSGSLRLGHNVSLAYYAQNQEEMLNLENTVYGEFAGSNPGLSETEARTLLGSFLFTASDVDKKVSVLSGGEKSRLSILKILVSRSNFLVLDEPTNHLDMESREVLLRALSEYGGTFLLISHDRYFVDSLAAGVWNVEGGRVETFIGNYSEFLERKSRDGDAAAPARGRRPGGKSEKALEAERRNRLHRELREKGIENMDDWTLLSKKQMEKALCDLEGRIFECEREKGETERSLRDPRALGPDADFERSARRLDELGERLSLLYRRWEEVTERVRENSP